MHAPGTKEGFSAGTNSPDAEHMTENVVTIVGASPVTSVGDLYLKPLLHLKSTDCLKNILCPIEYFVEASFA
jgi:hypothetical protein